MNLRSDRLATLYLAAPLLRLRAQREPSIPILMYHSIAEKERAKVHPYYRTATSPSALAAQLNFLRAQGYSTSTLAQAVAALQSGKAADGDRRMVLTFDDGFRNFYTQGFSLLQEHGFTAAVFLPTGYIGDSPIPFKGEDCLTWAEIRELKRHGIEFGSHTVTHSQLHRLGALRLREELVNSKETIEQKLGCAVESFAYPYAFPQADTEFTKRLRDLLRIAGYKNGVCTTIGRPDRRSERLFLERLPVNSEDDAGLLQAKLEGAYDWLGTSQYVAKAVKRLFLAPNGRPKFVFSNGLP